MKTNKTNKVSFTPGPWKVLEIKNDKELVFIVKSEERMIGSFHGFYSNADAKLKADANLIAAAPEMLEALMKIYTKLCSEQFQYLQNDFENELINIEKAIQKARGD